MRNSSTNHYYYEYLMKMLEVKLDERYLFVFSLIAKKLIPNS
jgi:hypothetical protein